MSWVQVVLGADFVVHVAVSWLQLADICIALHKLGRLQHRNHLGTAHPNPHAPAAVGRGMGMHSNGFRLHNKHWLTVVS